MKKIIVVTLLYFSLFFILACNNNIENEHKDKTNDDLNDNSEVVNDEDTKELSSSIINSIKTKYFEIDSNDGSIDKIIVEKYYGEYNNSIVVLIKDNNKDESVNKKEEINHIFFILVSNKYSINVIHNDCLYSISDAYDKNILSNIELFEICLLHNEYSHINASLVLDEIIKIENIKEINLISGLFSSIKYEIKDEEKINSLLSYINISFIDVSVNFIQCYNDYSLILVKNHEKCYEIIFEDELTYDIVICDSGYAIVQINNNLGIFHKAYISKVKLSQDSLDLLKDFY